MTKIERYDKSQRDEMRKAHISDALEIIKEAEAFVLSVLTEEGEVYIRVMGSEMESLALLGKTQANLISVISNEDIQNSGDSVITKHYDHKEKKNKPSAGGSVDGFFL